ncbi:MAG: hypothetical protein H6816_07880 [Phycisphaerales bacterium]|nr:hypothetical protein [Phycisphaerales bacterium]
MLVVILAAASARPQRAAAYDPPPPATYTDPDYDAVARRTDAGGMAPYNTNPRHLVDFHSLTLGRWRPEDPQVDRFVGDYFPNGRYASVEIVLGGLHNPPGDTDPGHFMPLAYGDNPVYGFVELDVDNDNDTGGEVEAPQYRYPANIARFGGLPEGDAFEHRIAKSADAFDGDFQTMPYVERQGEEFHLALLGGQFDASGVDVVAGDADLKFEAGEIWNITGTWFHRAHGFEPYSLASGGCVPGEYDPECVLRFAHDIATDTTTITLVFPLNNAAAADLTGENPQPNNHDASDQASVLEALQDLNTSATLVFELNIQDPQALLILDWKDHSPGDSLQPANWRPTVLLGVPYSEPGHGFVWTDVWPNVLRGDVDGDDGVNAADGHEIEDYIEDHDEEDGVKDERVTIPLFPANFCSRDVNQDGVVDAFDRALVSTVGDVDQDGDVDLADFALLQACLGWTAGGEALPCGLLDLDADGAVGPRDFTWWRNVMEGPEEH